MLFGGLGGRTLDLNQTTHSTAGEATMTSANIAVRPAATTRGEHSQFDTLRAGQAIEAKIESIGRDGKARLLVSGMTLEADVPIDLLRESTVKLLVKMSSDGSLMFELKRPAYTEPSLQPTTQHGSVGNATTRGHGLLKALLDIGAAIAAGNSGWSNRIGASATIAGPEGVSGIDYLSNQTNYEVGTGAAHGVHASPAPNANPGNTALPNTSRTLIDVQDLTSSPNFRQDAVIRILGTPEQQAAPPTIVVSYAPPGMIGHLPITVTHDDESSSGKRRAEADKSVKASFTFSSDTLGQVHVVLRQQDSTISVGVWAERPEVAAELIAERSELFDSLAAADIEVGVLEILLGTPPTASFSSGMPMETSAK